MYRKDEIIVRIGGAAGDGVASMGQSLAKIFTRQGLFVHGLNYYQSVIRGGNVGWNVRAANHPVRSQGDYIDIVIALTKLAAETYGRELREGGILIVDERTRFDEEVLPANTQIVRVPLVKTAQTFNLRLKVLKNTVALGILIRMLGINFEIFEHMLEETFGSKGEEVVKMNLDAAMAGYQMAADLPEYQHELRFSNEPKMFISGNEAAAVGLMAAGLKFYAAYPMTPATSILHFLAKQAPKYDLVVKQAEDELAVINMAIGASFSGVKSACATSGGGFALMTEAVGLAGMVELPVVVINSMRGGPSTGLPTNTEQGDLNQLFGASQGDFPRAIMVATNIEDSYEIIVEAMNFAELAQIPVLVALDTYLSEHFETVPPFDLTPEIVEREKPQIKEGETYLRYKFTSTGVSPRSIPGEPGMMYVAASDEHDEDSSLISDVRAGLPDAIEIRKRMVEKRAKKLELVKSRYKPPVMYGPEEADLTIVGWGSTRGSIEEAVDRLNSEGNKVNALFIRYIYPFDTERILPILENAKKVAIVEQNFSGQMRRHIRAETGFHIEHAFLKYDGTYLKPQEIVDFVKKEVL